MNATQLSDSLGLATIKNRQWSIQETSATEGKGASLLCAALRAFHGLLANLFLATYLRVWVTATTSITSYHACDFLPTTPRR